MGIQRIVYQDKIYGIFIQQAGIADGLKFFTPDEAPLQVGQHKYQQGKIIKPHIHCPVKQERFASLQEVLYVQKGKVVVTFYSEDGLKVDSQMIQAGDILILMEGGHGFEFIEPTEMLEIKQGPYDPESKKALNVKA